MPWTMVGQWWQNLCSIDFSTSVLLGSPDATEIRRSLTDLSCRLRSSMVIAARASYSRQVWSIPFFCLSMNCGVRRTPSNPYNHLSIFSTVGNARHHQIVAHGCSSETYGVIPKSRDGQYTMLLDPNPLMEDFPRRDMKECVDLLRAEIMNVSG